RGRRRLAKWKTQSPFDSGTLFQQRLDQGGLTEPELCELLSHRDGDGPTGPGEPPDWAREIGMALSDACEEESIPYPQTPNERPEILFLELIRPLIARALHKFRNGAQPLSQSQASLGSTPEGVERLCVSLLPGRLLAVLARTMALELNVARV